MTEAPPGAQHDTCQGRPQQLCKAGCSRGQRYRVGQVGGIGHHHVDEGLSRGNVKGIDDAQDNAKNQDLPNYCVPGIHQQRQQYRLDHRG